jgi:SPP1 gp7 family putative phage head morphogenesis protein
MAEQTSEYWQEHFKQMEDAQHDTSVQKVQEIQEQFDRSITAINGKINAWYQRLADNNGISMQEAKKLLNAQELKEFQWNVDDYIKYGKENKINGAWEKELENASARVHIGRLEALKIEIQQEAEKLYGNCVDEIDQHIRNTYTSDFYHTAYEIQKGVGVGTTINRLDPRTVEMIVCKPWAVDGKNFSDRLWENKTKLINNLHNSLSRMCITGEAPDRAIAEISKQMKVSRAQAGRVVMTESAAVANKARQDCMKELDVEQFEVVETLDSHTCETCGGMDGKHFPMTEFQIGVTAPPFHPNCRGCTCPYFDDEFDSVGERAARGEDGKTYYVPGDMTYEEWKNSFVDDGVSDEKFTTKRKSTDGSVEIPDIKFATKKNSIITAKQKFEDTMTVSKAYDELPIRVKQTLSDITFEFGWDGSACDIVNRTIRVGIGTSKAEIFHEVGHLIENYMMDQNVVAKYKEYLVDGLSYSDIMIKTYYNSIGEPINIYILTGNRFESEYQARLYVNKMSDALNIDGTINTDLLGESISEAFRKYMNNESVSDEVRKIIEGVVL